MWENYQWHNRQTHDVRQQVTGSQEQSMLPRQLMPPQQRIDHRESIPPPPNNVQVTASYADGTTIDSSAHIPRAFITQYY
mmetsp:Transcript_15437/g.33359  ORF Transcript_15437/g.33359 Transcript_15437/m.33359 type:complete len:80 (-) Transcript_15437:434-673(-)